MRTFVSLLLGVALSGCAGFGPGLSRQKALVVTDSNVSLAPPAGFCADVQSSTVRSTEAFVIYGNCGAIAGDSDAPVPENVSLVTVSVVQDQAGIDPNVLLSFVRSEAGKAMFSPNGEISGVEIINSFAQRGAVFVNVSNSALTDGVDGLSGNYWRAYVSVPQATLAVTVLGFEAAPLSSDEGLRVLGRFTNAFDPSAGQLNNPFAKDGAVGRLFN